MYTLEQVFLRGVPEATREHERLVEGLDIFSSKTGLPINLKSLSCMTSYPPLPSQYAEINEMYNNTEVMPDTFAEIHSINHGKLNKILYLESTKGECGGLRVEDLESASGIATQSNVAMIFKVLAIYYGFDSYMGMLPVSHPIKLAMKLLWGLTNPSVMRASIIQHQHVFALNREHDQKINALLLNTVLYKFGESASRR